ncbi:MAG: hypothetical protein OdinLCB4_006195 [Candidatus Odinarchaeum yellowstonii]|uniref:TIGR00267 family protein n=1 Tax=Odinarchaeota yellowstonii (strain LCB_4) TaxID=1841599 RepID=A0AAF0IAJ5_ODILC|nr:MAG: hypothetical protein OdinLCB4_006195 [Candidatus Odinarchaeum yellowstonii]
MSSEKEEDLESLVSRIRVYLDISGVNEIARRYFIMNSFDGVLTSLGIIIGSASAGLINTLFIISAVLGGAIAMAISGISGAYMAEKAERERAFKKLKKALIRDLKGSIQERALRFATFYVALVDGLAPFISPIIVLTPFLLAYLGFIQPLISLIISVVIGFTLLFTLGAFLGRISKGNVLVSGLKMIVAGVLTVLILFVLSLL